MKNEDQRIVEFSEGISNLVNQCNLCPTVIIMILNEVLGQLTLKQVQALKKEAQDAKSISEDKLGE